MSIRLLSLGGCCFRRLFIVAAACALLHAQFTTASLGGLVTDPSNAVVPGAQVTVRNLDTGFTQTTTAGPEGQFQFSRLPVGNYELKLEQAGFSAYTRSGIRLTVDQMATQNVTLQVGQTSEQVTVQAQQEVISTRTATGGQLVEQRQIRELPLQGRRPERLLYLAAGTVDLGRNNCQICGHGGVYPGQETAGVNGAGIAQVNFQLDGTSHNDTYLNAGLPFPNPDSVQEFNLQSSNFSAEYGNAAGGVVNIVTRSGSNGFHGSWFHFLRNGAMNARQFFAPVQDSLKRNQFGGALGGPILKNKLFFFGTFQGTRLRNTPAGQIRFVPTAEQRRGDFSALGSRQLLDPVSRQPVPGNLIPASRRNAVSRYFLDFVPLPNGPNGQVTFAGFPVQQTENQFMPKIDYTSGRHQLSGRYYFTDFDFPAGIDKVNVLAARGGNAVRLQNISVNHTFALSPTFLLTSTFGLNRQRGGSLSGSPFSFADAGVKILGPQDSALKFPPAMNFNITDGFSVGTAHKGDFDRGDFTIREVATKIHGNHEFRFGGEIVRVTNHISNSFQMMGNFSFNGQLSGNGIADFMFGRASAFTQGGGEFKALKGTRWSAFFQDNWRVSKRLALNLGLRWDPYWAPYDRQGRVVCFQPRGGQRSARYPNAPIGMLYGGDPNCPTAGHDPNVANFGPRIGLAYRLTEDGRTMLRTGVGAYYTPIQTSNFNPYTNIAPFAGTFTLNDLAFEDPYGSKGLANPFPLNFGPRIHGSDFVFSPVNDIRAYFTKDYRIPRLITWSFRLERQFGSDWVAGIAYLGNQGRYQQITLDENPAVFGPGATVGNTQQRRVYPNFGRVSRTDAGANSSFHSLQLNVEKRFSRSYSILTNYTWSKTIDNLTNLNPFNRNAYRGLANQDVPHNFKFSNIWDIPRASVDSAAARRLLHGWQVNTILVRQSPFPFSVNSGRDNSFSAVGGDLADFRGGNATLGTDRPRSQQLARWFDTSLFTANAPGTFGNSGRNIIRGPKFFNTDVGMLKDTAITERVSIQFRAEAFNVFNNPNFRVPNSNASSAQFGLITAVVDDNQRILQLGLKLSF